MFLLFLLWAPCSGNICHWRRKRTNDSSQCLKPPPKRKTFRILNKFQINHRMYYYTQVMGCYIFHIVGGLLYLCFTDVYGVYDSNVHRKYFADFVRGGWRKSMCEGREHFLFFSETNIIEEQFAGKEISFNLRWWEKGFERHIVWFCWPTFGLQSKMGILAVLLTLTNVTNHSSAYSLKWFKGIYHQMSLLTCGHWWNAMSCLL